MDRDLACARATQTHDQLDERRLARAVRAQESVDGSLWNRERHIVEDFDFLHPEAAAEDLINVRDVQEHRLFESEYGFVWGCGYDAALVVEGELAAVKVGGRQAAGCEEAVEVRTRILHPLGSR